MKIFSKFLAKIKQLEGHLYPVLFILLFISIAGFFYTRSHYVDVFNLCNISVDKDFLRGNSDTVIKAVSRIKSEDKLAYKDVCKYVNLISENLCPVDHSYGGPFQYNNQPGCFIKGSKIIYINPSKETSDMIIIQRAEAIKKYTTLSKNYFMIKENKRK